MNPLRVPCLPRREGGRTLAPVSAEKAAAGHPMLRLQRALGNRVVGCLLNAGESRPIPLQEKLLVGDAGDAFEKEADQVAERVMQMPGSALQRKCARCDERDGSIQRKEGASAIVEIAAPAIVHDVLGSPGELLDPDTRAFMETQFGRDFTGVRVHSDARAAESAAAVGAQAYTVGRHIVFGAASYAPGSAAGRRLLAHELVHTVQQDAGAGLRVQRQPRNDEGVVLIPYEVKAGDTLLPIAQRHQVSVQQIVGVNKGRGVIKIVGNDAQLTGKRGVPLLIPQHKVASTKADSKKVETFEDMFGPDGELLESARRELEEELRKGMSRIPPPSGVDDFETMYFDTRSRRFVVAYRDHSERQFVWSEVTPATPRMWARKKDIENELTANELLPFVIETWPLVWGVVGLPHLATVPKLSGQRPFTPGRVPLPSGAGEPPVRYAEPPTETPAPPPVARPPLQRPAAGRPPEPPARPGQEPVRGAGGAPKEEGVVVPLLNKPQGPGVQYGQDAAVRLAKQGKTSGTIIRPLAVELNARTDLTPMDKATAMQVACNNQGSMFGAGPIAKMPNGDLVVTPRAAHETAPVVIVKPDGTVLHGNANVKLVNGNTAYQVSNVTIKP